MSAMSTYLDLIDLVDSFPYEVSVATDYYKLLLPGDTSPYGYLHPDIVLRMPWSCEFCVDSVTRKIEVLTGNDPNQLGSALTAAFKTIIDGAIDQNVFRCLDGRHSELFIIPGSRYPVKIERFATSLFGTTTRGAHLTAYTWIEGQLMLWVSQRSQNVGTWKGMLDSTVAGGVAADETPFDNILREAGEEASLSEEFVRAHAKQGGVLTYMGISKGENDWEVGMALPDMVCVYDLELTSDMILRPCDDEVKDFKLMSVAEAQQNMLMRRFKPNSAVVMLDFMIRRGLITIESEKDYVRIVQRMHRRLPFPV